MTTTVVKEGDVTNDNPEWQEGDAQKSWEDTKRGKEEKIRRMVDRERLETLRGRRFGVIKMALEDAWLSIERRGYKGQLGLFEWEMRNENGFSIGVFFYYFESRENSNVPLPQELTAFVAGKVALAYSRLKLGVVFDENCGIGAAPDQAADVIEKMERSKRPVMKVLVPKLKGDGKPRRSKRRGA